MSTPDEALNELDGVLKPLRGLALLGAGAVLALALVQPAQAGVLSLGSQVTATANGDANALLGADSGYAAVAGGNTTTVSDTDLEFLSADFAIGLDFFSDGRLDVYDNTGTGLLAGTTVLQFSFAGLAASLGAFSLGDLSQVAGGSITAQLLDGQTLQLTLTDVQFSSANFSSFSAQVSSVPEPTPLALLAAGLGLMAWRRRAAPAAT